LLAQIALAASQAPASPQSSADYQTTPFILLPRESWGVRQASGFTPAHATILFFSNSNVGNNVS